MDWLDPEFWKPLAALADYWKTIAAAFIVIAGAVGTALKWGWKPISWAASKFRRERPPAKERPLRFVLNDQQSFWGPANRREEEGTQLHTHWHVTNISDRNFLILKARVAGYEAESQSRARR